MKTITIFAAFIFLLLFSAVAQEGAVVQKGSRPVERQKVSYEPVTDPMPVNNLRDGGGGYGSYFYYGDPSGMYLDPEWVMGSASLLEGDNIEGHFRYNIYLQKMECIVMGDTFAFAKPCELKFVRIGEQKFIYSTFYRSDYEVSNSWFEVLCEGGCELLLRRYIKYRVTDGDDDLSNDQLFKLEEYYTRRDGASPERMFITKDDVINAMKDHEAEVSRFIKSEKLKVKEQGDLVKLFAYYNGLD